MPRLITLSDLVRDHSDVLGADYTDPTGQEAYGQNGERVGTIRGALAEPDAGRVRYLIVDAGNWFASKEVVVPVGLARMDGQSVHFDSLSKDQVRAMSDYEPGRDYEVESQYADERILRAANPAHAVDEATYTQDRGFRDTDALYRTPDSLQLLEERLQVNKERFVAGSVEIGKRVETREEHVEVPLQSEEVVIERRAVTEARPVEGVVLGAATETVRVDLEAERANVTKQAFVTEEVSLGKRAFTETHTVTETVGREVLDVKQTGEVRQSGDALTDTPAVVTDRNN